MGGGLQVRERHLQFRLFKCHDLVASSALDTRGHTRALGHGLYPWYTATKPTSCNISVVDYLKANDIVDAVATHWGMSKNLIWVNISSATQPSIYGVQLCIYVNVKYLATQYLFLYA